MGFVRRFSAVVVALAAVLCFGSTLAQAQQVYWKTAQLQWSNGAYSRSFTASMTDTSFVNLPSDIAWDVLRQYTGVNNAVTIGFVTSAAAANADTVHFVHEYGVGGTWGYRDARDPTPALTNAATKVFAATGGLIYMGLLQTDPTTATIDTKITNWNQARLKVHGDPNGALTSLRCFVNYPSYKPTP
ncbi:MAG: hypothetical protein ABIP55_04050 [Tepidisphaeraceae bacterium]